MDKRRKILLFSMLTLCICTALIVGGTYALFSDKDVYENRLQAGKLDVTLKRTAFSGQYLNSDGYMAPLLDNTEEDLTAQGTKIFPVDDGSLIAPTTWYESEITVTNGGSVAFDYGIKIVNMNQNPTVEALEINKQIKITVTKYNTATNEYDIQILQDTLDNIYAEAEPTELGYFDNGTASTEQKFKIRMEFLDDSVAENNLPDESNNKAMNAFANFDIEIHATQKTSASSP